MKDSNPVGSGATAAPGAGGSRRCGHWPPHNAAERLSMPTPRPGRPATGEREPIRCLRPANIGVPATPAEGPSERAGIGAIGAVSSPTPPVSGVLTSVETALGLSLDEAQRGHPVKAVATVTYCHPQWRSCSSAAPTLGTFLKIPPDTRPCGRERLWRSRGHRLRPTASLK